MPPLSHSPSCSCLGTARPRLLKWPRVRSWMQQRVKRFRVCSWSTLEPFSSRPKLSRRQARFSGRRSRWAVFREQDASSSSCGLQLRFNPVLCVGSGCPVAAGASVASGTGSGPAAHLSPSPDAPSGPSGTCQLAQPADGHGELCVIRRSVRTRRGRKEPSWCVLPPKVLLSEDNCD